MGTNTNSDSNKDFIDKQMSVVDEIMKTQTGVQCRKNIWETVKILKEKYPSYIDYIENMYKELVNKNKTDFFGDIR